MAKKKSSKKNAKGTLVVENALPQNIMPIGERVEENKNIYISQPVYKEIHRFTKNKTTNESGGMLIGNVIEEFGKTNIIVKGFVEAKYCEATPTTLKFTHETWEYVHKEMDKKFPGQKIVGWIHTHPNFGIFLSEYDKFIQENFFKEEYQIAYVIDPIQDIEGFYFWINEKIEKCNGFYKFDKTGAKIEAEVDLNGNDTEETKPVFDFKNTLIAILSICVVFLFFTNLNQGNEISNLQKQQENIVRSANQAFSNLRSKVNTLSSRIDWLEEQIEAQLNSSVSDETENDISNTTTDKENNISENNTDNTSNSSNTNDTTGNVTSNKQVNGGNVNG